MKLPGRATREGTRRYFDRLKRTFPDYVDASWIVEPPHLPLCMSRIGSGTYRAHRDRSDHHDALREALISGINVIDTAPNHADGAAEVLVGNVIRELAESRRLLRDEVVVVSRAGFIEDSALQLLRDRFSDDTVEISPRLKHCINPNFLAMQIEWSLNRLGLDSVDVFLIQNPELQSNGSLSDNDFLKRLSQAFEHLESERRQGVIQYYGISSNILPSDEGVRFLERLISMAPPGFRVIQFPANILESGHKQVRLRNLAREKGLWSMSCRPLTALHHGRVVRLARMVDVPHQGAENPDARQLRLEEDLHVLEARILELINREEHRMDFDERTPSVYRTLTHYRERIPDLENVLPLIQALTGPFQKTASAIQWGLERSPDPDRGKLLFESYMRAVHSCLGMLPAYASYRHHLALEPLEKSLQQATQLDLPLATLSVQAMLAEGIDTVLVGMRRATAVRQMTALFKQTSYLKIPAVQESLLP